MYVKTPNYRYSSRVKLPENYSGNAFNLSQQEPSEAELLKTEISDDTSDLPIPEADYKDTAKVMKNDEQKIKLPAFRFDLGKLFSGGFGFEELLIIALILLISDSKDQDDIVLFLAILLFIK